MGLFDFFCAGKDGKMIAVDGTVAGMSSAVSASLFWCAAKSSSGLCALFGFVAGGGCLGVSLAASGMMAKECLCPDSEDQARLIIPPIRDMHPSLGPN